jgi:hypothetical protein
MSSKDHDLIIAEIHQATNKPGGSAWPATPDTYFQSYQLASNGMNRQPNHRFLTSKSEAAGIQAEGRVLEGPVFCAAR